MYSKKGYVSLNLLLILYAFVPIFYTMQDVSDIQHDRKLYISLNLLLNLYPFIPIFYTLKCVSDTQLYCIVYISLSPIFILFIYCISSMFQRFEFLRSM